MRLEPGARVKLITMLKDEAMMGTFTGRVDAFHTRTYLEIKWDDGKMSEETTRTIWTGADKETA